MSESNEVIRHARKLGLPKMQRMHAAVLLLPVCCIWFCL